MATSDSTDKLPYELSEGKKPEEIFGKERLLKDLTNRLVEPALEGEITNHPGYEPHSPTGRNSGNPRNGKTPKTVKSDSGERQIGWKEHKAVAADPRAIYTAAAAEAAGQALEVADQGLGCGAESLHDSVRRKGAKLHGPVTENPASLGQSLKH